LERLFCADCLCRVACFFCVVCVVCGDWRVDGFRFLSLLRRTSPFFEPSNGAKRKSVRRSNAPKTSERQNVERRKQGKEKRRERKESPAGTDKRLTERKADCVENGFIFAFGAFLRRDAGRTGKAKKRDNGAIRGLPGAFKKKSFSPPAGFPSLSNRKLG